jgi:hypothetical protein
MAATYFSLTMKNPSRTSESFLTRRISLVFFDHPAQKDAEVGNGTTWRRRRQWSTISPEQFIVVER